MTPSRLEFSSHGIENECCKPWGMAEGHVRELGSGSQNLRLVLKDAIQQKCPDLAWAGPHCQKVSLNQSFSGLILEKTGFLGVT